MPEIRHTAGAPYPRLALAIAAWIRYVSGIDEKGSPIEVSDPAAAKLALLARQFEGDIDGYASAVIEIKEIFGKDMALDATFRRHIIEALKSLYCEGAKAIVAAYI